MANSAKTFANGMRRSFGARAKSFRFKESINIGNNIFIWFRVDKNNQVCDCSRIGNAYDKLHGVPVDLCDPIGILACEYKDLLDSKQDLDIRTNSDNEILIAKLA